MRRAFTILELVFVILIMGIIGKFGVEFMAQAYQSFIFTNISHALQSKSASTVEVIASRLQYRIKDSIIARHPSGFDPLGDLNSTLNYTTLEWVGSDIDSRRGDSLPFWSGIADLNRSSSLGIITPQTDITKINTLINTLSNTNASISDIALYFISSSNNIQTGYGWDGDLTAINAGNGAMHIGTLTQNASSANFVTPLTEGYEYYKLAWTAYAVELKTNGDLVLHSDYQPWLGETFAVANRHDLLMKDVETFQFTAIGSLVKVQICVQSDLVNVEDYSICKEKTIY